MKTIIIAMILSLIGISAGDVASVEQHLISLDMNTSDGNLTGDDYIILLVNADIADCRNGTPMQDMGPLYKNIYGIALEKFPEYKNIYINLIFTANDYTLSKYTAWGSISREQIQNYMDAHTNEIIDYVFSSYDNELKVARSQAQARLAEEARQREAEAHRKVLQQEAEKQREAEKELEAAKQRAFDAYNKNLYDQYAKNISLLINQSRLFDAKNLTVKAISVLAAPERNAMLIRAGDICAQIDTYPVFYSWAIEFYEQAQTDFVCSSNDSTYRRSVWMKVKELNSATNYKINATKQKRGELISTMQNDLRDAPDVKQMLSGHDGGKKYTIGFLNMTYWGLGYLVNVTVDANSKPFDLSNETDRMIQVGKDLKEFAPICVDMLGALFADRRVARVIIEYDGVGIDKFGHKNSYAEMAVVMTNTTATQIGNWKDFKDYVGNDIRKIREVSSDFSCVSYIS